MDEWKRQRFEGYTGRWKAMKNNHFVVTTKQADWSENFTHTQTYPRQQREILKETTRVKHNNISESKKRFYGRLIIFHVLEHARDTERREKSCFDDNSSSLSDRPLEAHIFFLLRYLWLAIFLMRWVNQRAFLHAAAEDYGELPT